MGESFCFAPSQVSSINSKSRCQSVSDLGTAGDETSLDHMGKGTPGSGWVNWILQVTPKLCFENFMRWLKMCIAQCRIADASWIFRFAIRQFNTLWETVHLLPCGLSAKILAMKRTLISDLRRKSAKVSSDGNCHSPAYFRKELLLQRCCFGSWDVVGPHSAQSQSLISRKTPRHQLQKRVVISHQAEQLIKGKIFRSHKKQL